MIRIIPQTAQVQFDDDFTPGMLIDSIFDMLDLTISVLEISVSQRDLKKINEATVKIDHLCSLIHTALHFVEPIEFEFYKDKIMNICDFQKPYFDELGVLYTISDSQVESKELID
jgi:hypothetical protein